jgi:hypothetical protein
VVLQELVEFFERELVQANDPSPRPISRRHRIARLDLAVNVDDDPSAMIAVMATEVGVCKVVGASLQKKSNRPGARNLLGLVGHLYEKAWHGHPSWEAMEVE